MGDDEVISNTVRMSRTIGARIEHRINEKIKCFYCQHLARYHRKCKECEILLHPPNKNYITPRSMIQMTLEAYDNAKICLECFMDLPEKARRDKKPHLPVRKVINGIICGVLQDY